MSIRAALYLVLAAMSAGLACPAFADPTIGWADDAALDRIAARGAMLFAYDQAAWRSTDAIRSDVDRLARDGAQGWVVERGDGNALIVTYYGKDGGGLYALARLHMNDAKVEQREMFAASQRAPLSPMTARLVAAKDAAMESAGSLGRCGHGPFNPVLLPPETADGPITVYLLTPQEKAGTYPFGGHYRLEIDNAGHVISSRAFMKSCFEAPDNKKAKLLFLTHLLDPQPTEIHVFMSLWIGKPVIVGTVENNRMWAVNGARISLQGEIPSAKP